MPLYTALLHRRVLLVPRTVQRRCHQPFWRPRRRHQLPQQTSWCCHHLRPWHRHAVCVVKHSLMFTDYSVTWCATPVRRRNFDVSVVRTAARRLSSNITSKSTHAFTPARSRSSAACVESGSATRDRTVVTRRQRNVGQVVLSAQALLPTTRRLSIHLRKRQTGIVEHWMSRQQRPRASKAPRQQRLRCLLYCRLTVPPWLVWEHCHSFPQPHLSVSSRPR